jgi:hypothetical protein
MCGEYDGVWYNSSVYSISLEQFMGDYLGYIYRTVASWEAFCGYPDIMGGR